MSDVLSEDALAVLEAGNPDPDPVLEEMTAYGREENFPIVGPEAGRFLRVLAHLVGARRVFEFGSGFGYSAAWFAGALPGDGEIVLTDYDPDNLDTAREFLERAGYADRAVFEAGDAFESFDAHDGPYDVVFVDCEKSEYPDALDLARPELRPGGVVVADNVLAGPVTPAEVRQALDGDPPSETAAGIGAYIEVVRDDSAFDTVLVPLGEGLAVSRYEP